MRMYVCVCREVERERESDRENYEREVGGG